MFAKKISRQAHILVDTKRLCERRLLAFTDVCRDRIVFRSCTAKTFDGIHRDARRLEARHDVVRAPVIWTTREDIRLCITPVGSLRSHSGGEVPQSPSRVVPGRRGSLSSVGLTARTWRLLRREGLHGPVISLLMRATFFCIRAACLPGWDQCRWRVGLPEPAIQQAAQAPLKCGDQSPIEPAFRMVPWASVIQYADDQKGFYLNTERGWRQPPEDLDTTGIRLPNELTRALQSLSISFLGILTGIEAEVSRFIRLHAGHADTG
ncbi:hypothetical protein BJY52DRAFT_1222447 [Lactarius psammicola]|nr:hypothetical protein BJY52DRAFT_1222447 [Lactarius psammicola]